eukprot:1867698-Rhodomonas_salina.1
MSPQKDPTYLSRVVSYNRWQRKCFASFVKPHFGVRSSSHLSITSPRISIPWPSLIPPIQLPSYLDLSTYAASNLYAIAVAINTDTLSQISLAHLPVRVHHDAKTCNFTFLMRGRTHTICTRNCTGRNFSFVCALYMQRTNAAKSMNQG